MEGVREGIAPLPFGFAAFFPTKVPAAFIGGNFSFRPLYMINSLLIAPLGVVSGAQKTAFPSIFNERTTRTRLFAVAMISLALNHEPGNLALV
jgi:hypothetical protein